MEFSGGEISSIISEDVVGHTKKACDAFEEIDRGSGSLIGDGYGLDPFGEFVRLLPIGTCDFRWMISEGVLLDRVPTARKARRVVLALDLWQERMVLERSVDTSHISKPDPLHRADVGQNNLARKALATRARLLA